MIGSLNCPSCGAPAAANAVRCEYCEAALAVVTCPSCFASMFAGSQFCPHCGARAAVPAEEPGIRLPCPNCSNAMDPIRVGTTPMHQCSSCAGYWLTTDVFTALCMNREAQSTLASTFGTTTTTLGSLRASDVRYRRCAACQKMMNRVNFGRVSGIVIDLCKGHGVWFDPGELRNVLAFVSGGGLERMQASEAEFRSLCRQARSFDQRVSPGVASDVRWQMRLTSDMDESPTLARLLETLLT
jgi:Zn-finger nucleic acid-binding protein